MPRLSRASGGELPSPSRTSICLALRSSAARLFLIRDSRSPLAYLDAAVSAFLAADSLPLRQASYATYSYDDASRSRTFCWKLPEAPVARLSNSEAACLRFSTVPPRYEAYAAKKVLPTLL